MQHRATYRQILSGKDIPTEFRPFYSQVLRITRKVCEVRGLPLTTRQVRKTLAKLMASRRKWQRMPVTNGNVKFLLP